ncbi:hypothetical protein CYB_1156 [Synechococcus sp. JA-2-3B'a(2-13)]|nr:hypothetical protein CYB_1156 [Synechococcus sp. JA-2-3B'a(2-13)]
MPTHHNPCRGSPVLDEENEQAQDPQAQEYEAKVSDRVSGTKFLHGLNPTLY